MGEIADMMLDGDMCEGCGEYLGGGDGFPRRCYSCEPVADRLPPATRRKTCRGPKTQPRKPLAQRRGSPNNIAARIVAGLDVGPQEMRTLAQHVLSALSEEKRAELARAFRPVPGKPAAQAPDVEPLGEEGCS